MSSYVPAALCTFFKSPSSTFLLYNFFINSTFDLKCGIQFGAHFMLLSACRIAVLVRTEIFFVLLFSTFSVDIFTIQTSDIFGVTFGVNRIIFVTNFSALYESKFFFRAHSQIVNASQKLTKLLYFRQQFPPLNNFLP